MKCLAGTLVTLAFLAVPSETPAQSDGLSIALSAVTESTSCQVADILYGDVELTILTYEEEWGTYETAVIRSATFSDPTRPYGAILGLIDVDRGGFSVRNIAGQVVGIITPDLEVEAWGDSCADGIAEIHNVRDAYMIYKDGPVGTIAGRFPANDFGVE